MEDARLPRATTSVDTDLKPDQQVICEWPKDAPDTPPNPSTWIVLDQNGQTMAYCRNAFVAEQIIVTQMLAGQVPMLLEKIKELESNP